MDLMVLRAVLGLDSSEYEKGLDDAEKRGSSFGSGIKKAAGAVGKATAVAMGAAVTGISALTKASVDAYGNYEQLTGGVEKLFGDSAGIVMSYAENAYQTAGLSANAYMETVTGFSASLLQGLGGDTEAAAKIADTAITDMSDNANTYGTDMAAIQNAYMGFAKGNYTMLDNLKLGYGGTATEMVRLINDSGVLEEKIENLDNVSFDQIIDAIHVVQTELNISGISAEEAAAKVASGELTQEEAFKAMGTTAREGSTTIQGSLQLMQGAWTNFVTGLANGNADIGALVNNLSSAFQTVLGNLVPAVTTALTGIGTAVEKIVPIITKELPGLITKVLPPLLSAATSLVTGLVGALPAILTVLSSAIPQLVQTLLPAIVGILPLLVDTIITLVTSIGQIIVDNAPMLIDAALSLVLQLATGLGEAAPQLIPAVVDVILVIIDKLTQPNTLTMLINAAIVLIGGIATGIIKAIPSIVKTIPTLIKNLISSLAQNFPLLVTSLMGLLVDLFTLLLKEINDFMGFSWDDTVKGLELIKDGIVEAFDAIKGFFSDLWTNTKQIVSDMWEGIKNFFGDGLDGAKEKVTSGLDAIVGFFTDKFDRAKEIVSNAIEAIKGFFKFDWKLPDLKLPHFKLKGEFSLNPPSVPSIGVDWYKKAYDDAYLLNGATIFGAAGGRLLGGGEGSGSEAIVGTDLLRKLIREESGGMPSQIVIPIYFGSDKIDEKVISAQQMYDFISGGRG